MIIIPEFDPIGQAVLNYQQSNDNTPIQVSSQVVEDEDMPPDYFFREFNDMPLLERIALKKSNKKVLDVGAGAGCHSLWLQSKNIDVTALEISKLCCETMQQRGIKKVINNSIYEHSGVHYDTIILLMNGIGIAGTIEGLKTLLSHLKSLLNKGGKILLDSSDLIYLYEQEDGTFLLDVNSLSYYGEVDYQLSYKNTKGIPFSWLFIDHTNLSDIAEEIGFSTKILEYGPHYDYLAELKLK